MKGQSSITCCCRDVWRCLMTAVRVCVVSVALIIPAVPCPAWAGQIFLLDFDSFFGATTNNHDYTPAERTQITSEMNALFAPLGMSVTDTPPVAEPFSTVFFNTIAAGTSDGIDLGNRKKSDNAQVNAIKMLEVVGVEAGNVTSEKVVRASINVGMHEALHLVGARHQDAFTAFGTGVPSAAAAARYSPAYPGPAFATLTDRTFMSLTTLLGVTKEKLLANDLFISPRTAMKIIFGDNVTVTERQPGNNDPADAQLVAVHRFNVPNTVPPGVVFPFLPDVDASELEFTADATVISGSLLLSEALHPTQYYLVPVVFGRRYTIEAYSAVLDHRSGFTPVNMFVAALDPTIDGYPTLSYYGTGGFNFDGFETTDAAITDIGIPPSLEFIIVDIGPEGGGGAGDYELVIYNLSATLPENLPLLSIQRSDDDAIISWPEPADGFELEETDSLAPGTWTGVIEIPVLDEGRFTVTVPLGPGKKFFRLRKP